MEILPTVKTVQRSQLRYTDVNRFAVRASDIGIHQPWEWPDFIVVVEHGNRVYSFQRPTHATVEVIVYTCGSLELLVENA